jgi:2-polyprenyl-3-methyl-5-hydroxy-6-metoxy-1,4-benzoquinol methylase
LSNSAPGATWTADGTATIDNGGIACRSQSHCVLCGTEGTVLYSDLRDHLFGAPGRWSVRQCTNARCALGWVDPQPLPDQIGALYAHYYTHAEVGSPGAEASSTEEDFAPKPSRAKQLLAAVFPWRRVQYRNGLMHLEDLPPGRVLEVGCGSGAFLGAARTAGWAAEGIDFDAAAVAAANHRPGVRARVADIHDGALAAASYDAIVMNNAIEHLPHPQAVFARCAQLLKPGGRLVMTTPNMAALGREVFGGDWRGLEIPRHLYVYTAQALRELAREAGFRRAQAFSPLGGSGIAFMVEHSSEIARKAGRQPPVPNARWMHLKAVATALLGISRGEWVALVAEL